MSAVHWYDDVFEVALIALTVALPVSVFYGVRWCYMNWGEVGWRNWANKAGTVYCSLLLIFAVAFFVVPHPGQWGPEIALTAGRGSDSGSEPRR